MASPVMIDAAHRTTLAVCRLCGTYRQLSATRPEAQLRAAEHLDEHHATPEPGRPRDAGERRAAAAAAQLRYRARHADA